MNLLFWGLTIGVMGKVLLGVGVLIAHSQLIHERTIDALVIKSYRLDHVLSIIGLVLIVVGYGMEIYFYDFVDMLTCSNSDCALNAAAILSQ